MNKIILILILTVTSINGLGVRNGIIDRRDCIRAIFEEYDINYDGFLDKWECESLQHDTNPDLPLTWRDYKALCHMTNAIFALGLDLSQFSKTYNELSRILGTDLIRDFNKVFKRFKISALPSNSY